MSSQNALSTELLPLVMSFMDMTGRPDFLDNAAMNIARKLALPLACLTAASLAAAPALVALPRRVERVARVSGGHAEAAARLEQRGRPA